MEMSTLLKVGVALLLVLLLAASLYVRESREQLRANDDQLRGYTNELKRLREFQFQSLHEEAELRKQAKEVRELVQGFSEDTHGKVSGKIRPVVYDDMTITKVVIPTVNPQVRGFAKHGENRSCTDP